MRGLIEVVRRSRMRKRWLADPQRRADAAVKAADRLRRGKTLTHTSEGGRATVRGYFGVALPEPHYRAMEKLSPEALEAVEYIVNTRVTRANERALADREACLMLDTRLERTRLALVEETGKVRALGAELRNLKNEQRAQEDNTPIPPSEYPPHRMSPVAKVMSDPEYLTNEREEDW